MKAEDGEIQVIDHSEDHFIVASFLVVDGRLGFSITEQAVMQMIHDRENLETLKRTMKNALDHIDELFEAEKAHVLGGGTVH